jgi:DNA-3-methyladenine glycosylase II
MNGSRKPLGVADRFLPPHNVLLRGLGRLHIFPGDDVWARNNLPRLGLEPPLDYAAVKRAVSRWQPYAGMVYFHLVLDHLEAAGELGRDEAALSR